MAFYGAQQAAGLVADRSTSAQVLGQIAVEHRELWGAIASHPNVSVELVQWMRSQGGVPQQSQQAAPNYVPVQQPYAPQSQPHAQSPQPGWNGYPPAAGPVATPRKSGKLPWILSLSAVAVAAVLAVVLWGVLSQGGGAPVASPQPTSPGVSDPTPGGGDPSPAPTPDPSPSPSEPDPHDEWGPVLPPNLDRLKDFYDPVFPQQVGTFELMREPNGNGISKIGSYSDNATFRSVMATALGGSRNFAGGVDDINGPQVVGEAVCGTYVNDAGTIICFVAGSRATLEFMHSGDQMSIQELGEFANEFLSKI